MSGGGAGYGCACRAGCVTQPCGCCEGVTRLTPAAISNRPGMDTLAYRVGTHAEFFETMQARVSTMAVDGVGPDGQTVKTWRPLQGLTTRDRGDLSIALLDGWATVADVLTFYQERIANEGFLRTATERRSVLELAHLVGYTLRPGVAATVYLAYTIDDKQIAPALIAAGARSQSVPAPGESPQSFETSEDLEARGDWNNLQVRRHRPQNITLDNTLTIKDAELSIGGVIEALRAHRHALAIDTIRVAGTATDLKPGDKLLLTFSDNGATSVVRSVAAVDTAFPDQTTAVALRALDRKVVACVPLLVACIATLVKINSTDPDPESSDSAALDGARALLAGAYLGLNSDPAGWPEAIATAGRHEVGDDFREALKDLSKRIGTTLGSTKVSPGTVLAGSGSFAKELLKPAVPQVANSLRLSRNLTASFAARSDASPQLLVQFAPSLRDTFYRAWSGTAVATTPGPLKGLFVLRSRASLFGATASKLPSFADKETESHFKGELLPLDQWLDDWKYADDEKDGNAFLDQANEGITPGAYVLAHVQVSGAAPVRQVLRVAEASVSPRSAYGLSGPSTALVFEGASNWRIANPNTAITDLRGTQIYAQSEPLTLVDEPITAPVDGQEIELGTVYSELKSGRWVILSGERADIPGVSGVPAAELLMISGLRHGFDSALPGDRIHTTLILATAPAFQYRRDTLTIFGNVVKATNGETRNEILGSGDGAQSLQSFTLKQPPLTFVAVPTASGAASTLRVYVDNVEWRETDSLAGVAPREHRFVTAADEAGATELTFGNGVQGARLPSGLQNVVAIYRNGIGTGGNVKAQQVSLLTTRPLGVMSVINPLRASGGADKESRDLGRENIPLSVMPLDRLVSVADYADFTRSFAGIAKATARQVSAGRRQLIHLTIAGVDDIPIDSSSDLYQNLLAAFRKLGDGDLPVRVDPRELTALVLSAGVKLLPDYLWEPVATAIRARLLYTFGFGKRALGQPALLCEAISAIQGVPGVDYVDIDAFGGVPEKKTAADGTRVLLDPDDIDEAVAGIVSAGASVGERVDAFPGGVDHGVIRPAQLVILSAAVADTLILNQLP